MKVIAVILGLVLLSGAAQAQSVAEQSKEVTTADAAAKLMIQGPDASGRCTQGGQIVQCPAKLTTGTAAATITNHAGSCQTRNGHTVCK